MSRHPVRALLLSSLPLVGLGVATAAANMSMVR
jgi:hypothetical protein